MGPRGALRPNPTRKSPGTRRLTRATVTNPSAVPYQAKSWSTDRRTCARIEATTKGLDIRFVVTSIETGSAEHIYQTLYCARGQAENLIKLHKAQLASDRTTILYPVRAGELARVGPAEVRARYGVDPAQVPDFIALRGDPSDKVPGAPGVGATGAATLLQRYGSLEAALSAGRFPAIAESLRLYRSIATMNRKAALPSLRNQTPTWHKAAALAREWELNQLAGRLEELAVG